MAPEYVDDYSHHINNNNKHQETSPETVNGKKNMLIISEFNQNCHCTSSSTFDDDSISI